MDQDSLKPKQNDVNQVPTKGGFLKGATRLVSLLAPLAPVLVIAGLLALGAALFLPVFGKPLINLVQREESSWSVTVLEEARDTLKFSTVQYVYKVVFPYDFFPKGMNTQSILDRIAQASGRRPSLLEVPALLSDADGVLLDAERSYLGTLQLAREIGLRHERPWHEFVVASVVVEAGLDFGGTVFQDPTSLDDEELAQVLATSTVQDENGREFRKVVLWLPDVRVSEVRIEDRDEGSDEQPYPNVELRPASWKRIADFIDLHFRDRALGEGILLDARANARSFLEELFIGAGFDEVLIEFDDAAVRLP